MVISRLKGGFGNQLFQWAISKHLSVLTNSKLHLDTSFYNNNLIGVTKRHFLLDRIKNLKFEYFSGDLKNANILSLSDGVDLNKLILSNGQIYNVDGYFQDYRYFSEITDIIKKELQMDNDTQKYLEKKYGNLEDSVSLHVRRTDYLNSNGYHPVLTKKYYSESLEIIGDYERILVFSDDIGWCRQNLNLENMQIVESHNEILDFYLMSLCRDNICANSTFSWWSAWLNNNKDKKVIIPKKWLGQNVDYDPDSSPKEWIRI